jgi:hypothetical protein
LQWTFLVPCQCKVEEPDGTEKRREKRRLVKRCVVGDLTETGHTRIKDGGDKVHMAGCSSSHLVRDSVSRLLTSVGKFKKAMTTSSANTPAIFLAF